LLSLYLLSRQRVNTGQYRLVRFAAPVAGTYNVTAKFEGVHFGLSTTDVRGLHNGASLFDADIDGCGGDPVFHTIRSSPTYSDQVALKEQRDRHFAVRYGKNKAHFGGTTGLTHVTLLPIWHEAAKNSHQESLKDGI